MREPLPLETLEHHDEFVHRHIGPTPTEIPAMLASVGVTTLSELIEKAVPPQIIAKDEPKIAEARSEREVLSYLSSLARQNKVHKSFLGLGYSGCFTPPVILRNIMENPAWYTAYTPYQAEISQGRMEALLNFQTMVMELTGMEVANSSLLDEGTAAAEAMALCKAVTKKSGRNRFWVAEDCHPQTIEILQTRAEPLGIELTIGNPDSIDFGAEYFGLIIQYPNTGGSIRDPRPIIEAAHSAGTQVVVASDLLSLMLLEAPGKFGADVVIGNSQRFGVPLGFGGPHAAYFATREENRRLCPGRIVGVSKDSRGKNGLRLALQTREQHIRREKATSNICTAQVLLAVMASMYAVYHGPRGLDRIANRVHRLTAILARGLGDLGMSVSNEHFFDTISVAVGSADEVCNRAEARGYLVRRLDDTNVSIACDELTTRDDVEALWQIVAGKDQITFSVSDLDGTVPDAIPADLARTSPTLSHPIFESCPSETDMLRYLYRLQEKDLALTKAMIPLGSCTMKLNATTEMIPVTWPEFGQIHPFAPLEHSVGYRQMIGELETMLAELTGFHAISLQPNAGSQGEYAGLLVIRRYHEERGDTHRNICLIPSSAHGTNPASAVMAGMKVVVVACDDEGNIDVADLKAKATEHAADLAALMVTYPSTHGVFETSIVEICDTIHEHGGQVYMDGANLNALVGICQPGKFGPDVAHLNLHKTFCIPHGGGGPGVGPIGVVEHLAPYLPGHSLVPEVGGEKAISAVSAAPWGSSSILPISWSYIALMGRTGMRKATQVAILNANYIAKRLEGHYDILYTGPNGMVAHECIVDVRPLKNSAGVTVDDIAKRLIDFGFHAPTMSWPVAGTLMIEPTESEPKSELDRFCDAMIAIREEAQAIEEGKLPRDNNPLCNAPHTLADLVSDWDRPYTREQAAYPTPWVEEHKFWPAVNRVDNAYGDRHFVCACPPIEEYAQ